MADPEITIIPLAERIYPPEGIKMLSSSDGNTEAVVSHQWGAQVLTGLVRIRGQWHDIILPIIDRQGRVERHAVGNDNRPDTINTWRQGETFKPGTSFLSFFRDVLHRKNGKVEKPPVHGSAGAPYKPYHVKTPSEETNHIQMIARPDRRDSQFFNDGEAFQIEREVITHPATGRSVGSIEIKTRITSRSRTSTSLPDVTEHLYLVGGAAGEEEMADTKAVIYAQNGALIEVEGIKRVAPENGNDIDTTIDSEELAGTRGRVVFLPEGPAGHVVVIKATMQKEGEEALPVNNFFLYRFRKADEWTAIEPFLRGISLNPDESVDLDVSVQMFETLEEYRQTYEHPYPYED